MCFEHRSRTIFTHCNTITIGFLVSGSREISTRGSLYLHASGPSTRPYQLSTTFTQLPFYHASTRFVSRVSVAVCHARCPAAPSGKYVYLRVERDVAIFIYFPSAAIRLIHEHIKSNLVNAMLLITLPARHVPGTSASGIYEL